MLEAAFEEADRPFREVFPGSRIREASRAIQLGKPFLLKLHGDYYDADSRVLTLDEYTREYGSPDPEKVDLDRELPSVLHQALGAWPLLFLGCSLKNDRTTRVIARIAKRLPGTMHFALLPESDLGGCETQEHYTAPINTDESSKAADHRRQQLYSWNIRPLLFPAGEFEKIDQFLAFLAKAAALPAEGIADRITVADFPDAAPRTLPETMKALLAAVRDPKGSVTLTPRQVTQIVREFKPRNLTEYRLARIAEWSQPRYQIDRRFVSLTLLIDQGEDAQGARWAATTLLASVMARDPAAFIRALMGVNLPLASRCAAMPELPAAPGFQRHIQQALITRTQDMSADLRARMAAGLALGNLGDPRFERRTGPHGDYLLPPLVTIPAGEYPIGSDEGLYNNEAPVHTVRLGAFQIGAFPVTNAEYALFIAPAATRTNAGGGLTPRRPGEKAKVRAKGPSSSGAAIAKRCKAGQRNISTIWSSKTASHRSKPKTGSSFVIGRRNVSNVGGELSVRQTLYRTGILERRDLQQPVSAGGGHLLA